MKRAVGEILRGGGDVACSGLGAGGGGGVCRAKWCWECAGCSFG